RGEGALYPGCANGPGDRVADSERKRQKVVLLSLSQTGAVTVGMMNSFLLNFVRSSNTDYGCLAGLETPLQTRGTKCFQEVVCLPPPTPVTRIIYRCDPTR